MGKNMIESDWRNKLVHQFNKTQPLGMIWINDVRYKAGWPDVYTVVHGVSSHYELKLWKHTTRPTIEDCMTDLQIAVCKRLARAGARTFTLINCTLFNSILVYDFITGFYKLIDSREFELEWIKTGGI
jgi:hypothetical protein